MAHDFSHLDNDIAFALNMEFYSSFDGAIYNLPKCTIAARNAILSALTPSDLAALLAEKCPGWTCVPINPTEKMIYSVYKPGPQGLFPLSQYRKMLSAAPKLGEE